MSENKSAKNFILSLLFIFIVATYFFVQHTDNIQNAQKEVKISAPRKCLTNIEGKITPIGLSKEVLNDAVKKNTTAKIKLVVTNNSKVEYKFENNQGFNIGAYWEDKSGKSSNETRAVLKDGLQPNKTKEYNLEFAIPKEAGKYKLIIAFVEEGCNWSHKQTNSTSFTSFEYEVTPRQ